jgi:DNA polymerase-1
MLAVDHWIDTLPKDDVRMIMQVHDELVFEIKEHKLTEYKNKIISLMEHAVQLDVPLTVEAGVGINWDEAH